MKGQLKVSNHKSSSRRTTRGGPRWVTLATFLILAVIACGASLLVAPPSARADIILGTVSVSADQSSVSVAPGGSVPVAITLNPTSKDELPMCGMDVCSYEYAGCGDGCFDANGQCTCAGTVYSTYFTNVIVRSSDPAVATGSYFNGVLTIAGVGAGTADITVSGSLRKFIPGSATIEAEVTASNVAPAVSAGLDVTIVEGHTFAGSGTFSDPDPDTWTATVDYGDGSGIQALPLQSDHSFSLSHPYGEGGHFSATVAVTDNRGAVGRGVISVVVEELPANLVEGAAGWNLLAGDSDSDTAGHVLFGFEGGSYVSVQDEGMKAGRGYWCKLSAPTTLTLGSSPSPLSPQLQVGWNLIGNSADASVTLPQGLVVFTYQGGTYVSTTTLAPGEGAWLKSEMVRTVVLE